MPCKRASCLLLLLFLALAAAVPPAFAQSAPRHPEDILQDDHPARTMTFTPESAAALAARLIEEQKSPELQEAWNHINYGRYEQAAVLLRPLADGGNSMAMFWLGDCLWKKYGASGMTDRMLFIPNEKAQEYFWKSANAGNFYALNFVGIQMGQYSVLRVCEEYCRIRAQANDPDATFCLYLTGLFLRHETNVDYIVRAALLGSDVAVLFMTGSNADSHASFVSESLNREIPDWRERLLVPLKALADAGNHRAQWNYARLIDKAQTGSSAAPGMQEDARRYLEQAFQGREGRAALDLAGFYAEDGPTPDNVKKVLFCTTVHFLDVDAEDYIRKANLNAAFGRDGRNPVPISREEFRAEVERARAWRAARPDLYNYRHPLWDSTHN